MPPKKKTATTNGESAEGGGTFRWTPEIERKLLILSQGRYLTSNDYDRFLTVFPGTNLTGLKIKVSRFRVEQRTLYEQLGWQLPEGAASQKRKRGTSAEKPTAKRAKKEMAKGSESEDEIGGVDIGVKKEEVED